MLKLGDDMADLRLVGLILPLGSHRSLYHLLWVHRHVVPSESPSKHLPHLNRGNRTPSSKDTPYEHRSSRFPPRDTMPSNSACPERNAWREYTTSRSDHQYRKRMKSYKQISICHETRKAPVNHQKREQEEEEAKEEEKDKRKNSTHILLINRKAMIDARRQNQHIPLLDLDPHPSIVRIAHIEIPAPLENPPDLLIVMHVLLVEFVYLRFVGFAHAGGRNGDGVAGVVVR